MALVFANNKHSYTDICYRFDDHETAICTIINKQFIISSICIPVLHRQKGKSIKC